MAAQSLSAPRGLGLLHLHQWLSHHRLLALLAVVTGSPFVFPSLGPTAYLLFIAPLQQNSSPRNTILGHAIGLACGYGAYVVTGAASVPYGVHPGDYWPRILSAALSLSAAGAFMVLLRADHPPAGATTLIVSLGIISKPKELVIIEVTVFIRVAQPQTVSEQIGFSLRTERLVASLSAVFGGVATLLAVVGLYGVMAYAVLRRTREIGIRIALGALRSNIVAMVMREVLLLIGCGLAARGRACTDARQPHP